MLWRARGHGPVAPPLTPDNSTDTRVAGVSDSAGGQLSRVVRRVALLVTLRCVASVLMLMLMRVRSAARVSDGGLCVDRDAARLGRRAITPSRTPPVN
jgi:hypothetical protein